MSSPCRRTRGTWKKLFKAASWQRSPIHGAIYIYDSLEIMNQTMDIDVTPDFEINFMSPSHCFQ